MRQGMAISFDVVFAREGVRACDYQKSSEASSLSIYGLVLLVATLQKRVEGGVGVKGSRIDI